MRWPWRPGEGPAQRSSLALVHVTACVPATHRRVWTAVVILLALYAAMTLSAARVKGTAFDEGAQLITGYNIWLHGDYRTESANGDFVKRWATLPYLWTRPKFVSTTGPSWRAGDPYWAGERFLFELGNGADSLLLQGRIMIILSGVATGLLVFACVRELFGQAGGVLALGVFVFSPNMLAFGISSQTRLAAVASSATARIQSPTHRACAVMCAVTFDLPRAAKKRVRLPKCRLFPMIPSLRWPPPWVPRQLRFSE